MVVPVPVQHQIAQKAPLVAYVPTRLAIDWHRCVNRIKLVVTTSLPPNRFADVGLGRIAASGHRIL